MVGPCLLRKTQQRRKRSRKGMGMFLRTDYRHRGRHIYQSRRLCCCRHVFGNRRHGRGWTLIDLRISRNQVFQRGCRCRAGR